MTTTEHSEPDKPLAVPLSDQLGLPPHYTQLMDGTLVYTADQMRAYAEREVAAERERWAAIAKGHMDLNTAMGAREKARTAASILADGLKA